MTFVEFQCFVEALCRIHSASVTGGRRTPKRNLEVGGAPGSAHVYEKGHPTRTGLAADLEPDAHTKFSRDELASDAKKLGFWILVESDHVHVHWRD